MGTRENDFIISNIQDRLNRILVELNELSCMENPRMALTRSHIIYHLDSLCRDILSVHIWVPFHDRVVQCVTDAWQILRPQVECDKEEHAARTFMSLVASERNNYKNFLMIWQFATTEYMVNSI